MTRGRRNADLILTGPLLLLLVGGQEGGIWLPCSSITVILLVAAAAVAMSLALIQKKHIDDGYTKGKWPYRPAAYTKLTSGFEPSS